MGKLTFPLNENSFDLRCVLLRRNKSKETKAREVVMEKFWHRWNICYTRTKMTS